MADRIQLKLEGGKTAIAEEKVLAALYELWDKANKDHIDWCALRSCAAEMECEPLGKLLDELPD